MKAGKEKKVGRNTSGELCNKDDNMKGKVDIYFPERGFGFISTMESGVRTSHFFHISRVIFGEPVRDAEVEFIVTGVGKDGKTAPAINVKVAGVASGTSTGIEALAGKSREVA